MKKILKKILPESLVLNLAQRKQKLMSILKSDYSQSGETIEIRKILNGYPEKFFVEIGANDGITFSTTFGLVKKGWRGIAVEPNPKMFNSLKKNLSGYSGVKAVCCAVAPKRGKVKLFFGKADPQGLLSTICLDENDWFEEYRSSDFVEVDALPITDLLLENGVSKTFGLLLIDTEGMDYDILQTLDFSKFRPRLIITEEYAPKNSLKEELLINNKYSLYKKIGYNAFWTDTLDSSII